MTAPDASARRCASGRYSRHVSAFSTLGTPPAIRLPTINCVLRYPATIAGPPRQQPIARRGFSMVARDHNGLPVKSRLKSDPGWESAPGVGQAAAQRCTTGTAVACPRSPREGPARGATRPRGAEGMRCGARGCRANVAAGCVGRRWVGCHDLLASRAPQHIPFCQEMRPIIACTPWSFAWAVLLPAMR